MIWWTDVRWAWRTWMKKPAFTATAVLTLALGIGASTAIFSLVNAILLRPLPIDQPERVVYVRGQVNGRPGASLSPADYLDYRQQLRTVTHFAAAMTLPRPFALTGRGDPEQIAAGVVTPNYFEALGVQAALGRLFDAREEATSRSESAVLSHALWMRRFGGRADLIGQPIVLDGSPFTVVGIAPASLREFGEIDLWLPVPRTHPSMQSRSAHFLRAVARLAPGISLTQAQAEADAVGARLERAYPATNAGHRLSLTPLTEVIVGDTRRPLLLLMGAVGFVLLIACVNVANLLLVRATGRTRELAIRAMLGASRLRIARQLLVEGMLLFAAGGMLGALLAAWMLDAAATLVPTGLPRLTLASMDLRTLAFAGVTTALTGVAVALLPAWWASTPLASLRQGPRSRLRHLLVLGEVALAMVPLAGAALLAHSFIRLQQVDPGFETTGQLAFHVGLSPARVPTDAQRAALFEAATNRLRALPGVEAVGLVSELPLTNQRNDNIFYREGRPPADPRDRRTADFRAVNHEYFRAMGIPLRRGREFTALETRDAARVAIVSQSLVDELFPGEEPLGQRLTVNEGPLVTYEIVGVVGNIHHRALQIQPYRDIYVPRLARAAFNVVVRTAGAPGDMSPAVRKAWLAVDSQQPLADMRTLEEVLSRSLRQPRFRTALMTAFALAAVLLACLGIAGVVTYNVVVQTREIGIRMALGAERRTVVRGILRASLAYTTAGVAIGAASALALAGLLRGLLYDLEPRDLPTLASVAGLFLLTTAVTAYLPARRAARVDPVVALRQD